MNLSLAAFKRALRFVLTAKFGFILMLAMPGVAPSTQALAQFIVPIDGQAAPYHLPATDPTERAEAERCLAEAVYYEAGFEPQAGQRAVAQVVVNRVRDPNFPQSVCGVVYQGWKRATGCQFTFTCDGSLKRRPPTEDQMEAARVIARDALTGHVEPLVGTATHYHTDYVAPYWRTTLVEVTKVGQHIFYRWPGHAGEPEALTAQYAGGEDVVREAVAVKYGQI